MVSNFTELLEKEYADKLDQDGREYMRFILQGSQRMQNLITDLLEYSRLRSEHQDFQEFDSRAQVDLAIANMGKIINDTHAKITIGPLPIIRANPIQFVRLMQNLISNAIKYRHPERQPEIKIEALEQEHEWMFSVKDNGIGMKEEYLQQIFVIFKRLHNKDEYYGTGIGLAVCKKIVESLYGKIWVESDYGDGSCFYFTVPKPRTERTENDEET